MLWSEFALIPVHCAWIWFLVRARNRGLRCSGTLSTSLAPFLPELRSPLILLPLGSSLCSWCRCSCYLLETVAAATLGNISYSL